MKHGERDEERQDGGRVQQAAHTRYARYFLFFKFNSNDISSLPAAPTTPKNEHDGLFSGVGPLSGNHLHP